MINVWGQEVKGQGHTTPKLDLETWWSIILDPFPSVGFLVIIIIIFNPLTTRVGKKLKKLRKNGVANVPSGRPTQNYCATKQN